MSNQQELKSRPSFQSVLSAQCGGCFVSFGKVVPRRIEEGLEILLCSRCFICVHKCCYDFEASLTVQTDRISEFLCERCQGPPLPSEKDRCLVCYGTEGAMKRIGDELVHVYCALMHNDIEAVSYYPTLTFRKSPYYEDTPHSCQLCKKKNAYEQCAEESCRRKVHVYCAKSNYVAMAKQSDDQPRTWDHRIIPVNHGNFDLSDEIIPYELFSEEVDAALRDIEQLGLDLSFMDEIKKRVHRSYLEQTRSRRKSTKKLRRGGFSFVVCPQHESPSYCSCYGKADGDEMVLCECCFEWYHQKCIKIPPSDDSYICERCRSFYDFKRKAIDELRGGRNDYDISKLQFPLRTSSMDCLWVLRVADHRIRAGQSGKMMRELNKFPLKSSCMDLLIRQHNRPKIGALVEECLKGMVESEMLRVAWRPKRVLACDPEGRAMVCHQNVQFNRILRRGVQLLLSVVGGSKEGGFFPPLLRELEFKERALSDSYEQIIELSRLQETYQELQVLRQKAQAYNFVGIVQKIKNNTHVGYQEVEAALERANSTPNLPAYLAATLRNKFEVVSPIMTKIQTAILTAPDNTYVLAQLVEQLQAEHVLPPQKYLQLTVEKRLVQGLFLYLAKQEGGRIQEELTVAQQLEQLTQGPSLRPSQELLDILAEYSNFANGKQISFVWPALGPLLEKYQGVAVDFQIRQLAKRKFSKQERFLSVVDRAASVDHALLSEQSRGILQVWGVIKASFDHLMGMSLEETAEYEPLAEGVRLATSFMESIENFAIRLEEEGGKALLQQAKTRREELQQLRTLYTEAHLQKNPLTLPKILSSLPKNNPLVKQWHSLKKQLSGLQGKFTTLLARINQRIEYFKTEKKLQRKQQIRDNNEKPTLAQANELLQALKHSSVQMGKQVRELTRIINNSLEIAAKVRRYIEERGDCNNSSLEELAQRRKEIDQQRKRVLINAELSLRGELIELYHLEICNRMRTSLLSPGLQLEKIGTQLKFAEEEGLMHTPTYCALKEKFENKNQKSKEVAQLKGLQQGLANQASKDSSFNFAALAQYRSRQALPDLPQIKTKNTYLDQLADRSRAIRQRASQALMPSPKWELGEARAVYLQALKSPYIQPDVSRLGSEINKAWEVVRRCRELGRSLSHLHPIFVQYEGLAFTVEQIQVVRREVRNNEEELTRLQRFVNSFDEKHRDQLQEIIQRIQTSGAVRETQLCRQAQLKYIRFWTKLLQCCKIAKRQIPFEKIRRLALDAYNLLQRCLRSGEDYQDLKTSIYELEDYLIMSKNHLKCYPCRTTTNLIADTFIDMDEFYLQHDDEEADLADAVPLLRPFSDLPKFRVKNLQRLEWRRQDLGLKRSRDKLDELPPERPSLREVERSSPEPAPVGVSESQRRKIKEIFLKNIRKNPELRRYGQCENQVKMIENQIFGEWHKDIVKYFEMSQQFQRLFMKLVHCPNISNKLIKKKFEFKFIQILVANLHKIDELEAIILTKLKEMDAEKTITRVAQPLPDATAPSQPAQEALIDSIAQGKVPEGFKQDLKKEMKLLKEGKHRKKNKHHKHRSRSRSPDAKFSSESQKELPSYIQNEYNKDESRPNPKPDLQQTHQMLTESPLRYDPQQEEMQTRQATFPRGSILRVKACDLQTSTKRRGKVELGVQVLTEQQHRKVVGELFDPGFTRLPIKKDKNQGEIIQYIAKSKKKYKYLVCWFEALRSEDNEVLKEIAVQANEKRKIFGWQNEHIKIHIMSMRQLVMVGRFVPPARVSSLSAAQHMAQERLVMVVQYPEKVYEVRDLYKPFESIERKQEEYPTTVPAPVIEQPPAYDFYPKYTMPTIEPLVKPQPVFDEQKTVYEGWGETVPQQPLPVPMPQLPQQLPPQQLPPPMPTSNLPYKVNQIRLHFGFSSFSPILTDEDEEGNNNGDLASDLLNSLGDFKMPAQPQSAPRDKPPQPPPPQQQYQGYYGYGYQSQPQTQQRPVPADNRWADYRGITQQTQGMPQQQVYNPLNPMAGKYPPMPAQMGQMGQGQMGQQMGQGQMGQYKNPMMERQRQNQPQMGQYYRGPSSANEGYDRRYQGGYQQ